MNYRPKVVRCRLKTGGKSIPQIREECRGQGLTYRDFENIRNIALDRLAKRFEQNKRISRYVFPEK